MPWPQGCPTRPITLLVPFVAGGFTDVVARALSLPMGKALGQTVIVENQVGAGGTIAASTVAQATPDGCTFLILCNGMATAPALYRKPTYHPQPGFEHISQAVDVPMTPILRCDDGPADLGAEPVPDTKRIPEGLRGWLKQKPERWGPVIRAAGGGGVCRPAAPARRARG